MKYLIFFFIIFGAFCVDPYEWILLNMCDFVCMCAWVWHSDSLSHKWFPSDYLFFNESVFECMSI